MRILIDTNVFISAALFPNSILARAFDLAVSGHYVRTEYRGNASDIPKKFPHKQDVLERFLASSMLLGNCPGAR